MKIKLLFLVLSLSLQSILYACGGINTRVYAGDISYALHADNPLNCSVTITLDFDIPDNLATDSIFVDWGDGAFSTVFATSITADSSSLAFVGMPLLYKHVYTGNHIYSSVPTTGFYLISPISQYRLNYASNILGGQSVDLRFYVQAQVAIDTPTGFLNRSPVLEPPVPGFAYTHTTYNEPFSFIDSDEDSIVFDLLPPLVGDDIEVPAYLFPHDFCSNLGQSSALSINHSTGEINWSSPCQQGVFTITRIVRKYRNGRLLGSTLSDQNIYVSASTGVSDNSLQVNFRLYPNPANSLLMIETNEPASFLITNILGKELLQVNMTSTSAIDISAWSNGVYFMRNEKDHSFIKFIKQ